MKLPRVRWWLPAAVLLALAVFLIWRRPAPDDIAQHLAKLRAEGIPTTLAELDAWYPAVPDQENAGPLLLEAASGFREVGGPALVLDFSKRPKRGEEIPTDLLAADRAYLETNRPTLDAIHQTLAHPHSRYPVQLTHGVMALLPHLASIKSAVKKIELCAEMAAEVGQPSLAARCLADQLRAAHTFEKEPLLISFLVELACKAIATSATERVLTRTQLSPDDLATLQRAFAETAAGQSYERGILGELCMHADMLRRPAKELVQTLSGSGLVSGIGGLASGNANVSEMVRGIGLHLYVLSGLHHRDLRVTLEYLDSLAHSARLPAAQRLSESRRLNENLSQSLHDQHLIFATMLLPLFEGVAGKDLRIYALLRNAETACAVERWRLAHGGALPPSLGALVPEYLAAVPEDPMDGKPLKFRPLAKGYVVYSIGEDGTDDGGTERVPGSGQTKGWDYTFTVAR